METCYTLAQLIGASVENSWSVAFTAEYMFSVYIENVSTDFHYVRSIDLYCYGENL